MKSVSDKNIELIVRKYKVFRRKRPDRCIDFCVRQNSLADVIETAAKAVDDRGKIHKHQRRVGRVKLAVFAEALALKKRLISHARTFDKLLAIIESVKCHRIADLTHYDTATRIGAYLNLFPDKIYLHTGTRVGAARLLGKAAGRKFISMEELPKAFLSYGLSASELEDIMCIFKDDFHKVRLSLIKRNC